MGLSKENLDSDSQDLSTLLARSHELGRGIVSDKAVAYDMGNEFPAEVFEELGNAGLLRTAVPVSAGGYGLGVTNGRPLEQWQITRNLAYGDLSVARCYEGHVNAVEMVNSMAHGESREEILRRVAQEGVTLVSWGSEQIKSTAGSHLERMLGSSVARRVEGGYELSGTKQFATSAGGVSHALVTVRLDDDSVASSNLEQFGIMFVDLDQPGRIEIDRSWWNSMGMRATASHKVSFSDAFVPAEHYLFTIKDYLDDNFQAKASPHFATSFSGALRAVLDFTVGYAEKRQKSGDPIIQQHLGQMSLSLHALEAFIDSAGQSWIDGEEDSAIRSAEVRAFAEQMVNAILEHSHRASGATALLDDYPLGRMTRDLLTYIRHDNIDALIGAAGRAALGLEYGANFGDN